MQYYSTYYCLNLVELPFNFHSVVSLCTFSCCSAEETPSPCTHQWNAAEGGDCCMKKWRHLRSQLHSQPAAHQETTARKPHLPHKQAWRRLSPTRRSASRSASGGSWEWRMWPSWRRASTATCTSPWWKTETLQHPGIITLPWLTLWEITWWGDGSEHSSFTMRQTQR